jgi:hypothetical protein
MKWLANLYRRFPAVSCLLVLLPLVSLCTLAVLCLLFRDARPTAFVLGDSCVGNYRFEPGTRLEDQLESVLQGRYQAISWAEPGASPADFFLQYSFGRLLAGRPEQVVIAIPPDKFVATSEVVRFDRDGANLRWLPWSRNGLAFWRTLDERERRVAVVQQVGALLFGATDALRMAWIRFVQWPWERAQMLSAPPSRRGKIEQKFARAGLEAEKLPLDTDSSFASYPRAHDFEFLIQALRNDGIEPLVVVLPLQNPDLTARLHSPKARALQDSVARRMEHWLTQRRIAHIDFNIAGQIERFPDVHWDDAYHLKTPAAFRILAEGAGQWINAHSESHPGGEP